MITAVCLNDEGTLEQLDVSEEEKVKQFVNNGCGCKKSCSKLFTLDYYTAMRNSCAELTRQELDMFVMGEISATVHDSDKTVSHRQAQDRVNPKSLYRHKGQQVKNCYSF